MTPALSAYVLALPLPVKLALLDADPTGPGWYVSPDLLHPAVFAKQPTATRNDVKRDSAWLPCNPLAIVEHAARLAFPGKSMRCSVRTSTFDDDPYGYVIVEEGPEDENLYCSGPCPYTAAIKLLEEVVRG